MLTRSRRSFEDAVRTHATLRADAPALISPLQATCTYGQLAAHLDRAGTALAEWMPAEGSVIAVAAENGPELFTAIVAALSRGICAPFDPNQPPAETEAFLDDVRPSLVLADEAAIVRHREAFERYGVRVVRMIAAPDAPAGVFDVRADEPNQRRAQLREYADDVALLLRTSGTTSSSKLVPHTTARLMHIATAIVGAVNLEPADRCLNARPLHHAHAMTYVITASLVAGASVVFPADISAATLVDGLRTYKPTWYTASPAVHREILAHVRRETTPLEHQLRFIRSASAPLDQQLVVDLEAALGAPLLDGYGTTEAPTCTLNPPPPAVRKPGSVGRALGCEVAIFDGEVAIRGANVAPSYAGGEREPIVDPVTGWYRTGDAGYIDPDGYIYITGRFNELINVDGEKVAPGNVEAALLAHPAVADAVAFPLPHPTLGQHVAAAVVLRADSTATGRQLIEHVARLLPRPAVPNVVHVVPAIARDGNGKVRRRDLGTTFAREAVVVQPAPTQLQDDSMLAALARIWEDVLEYAPVALDENFFAAGGDSLRATRVMTRIEADLGVVMSLDVLLFAPTLRELAQAVLNQRDNGTYHNRMVALRATGSRPPLFFYDSDVNGGGLYARFLQTALDAEQPVYLMRPNGAQGDTIPASIDVMAAADAALIATALPARCYRLAGFCAGGTVAFEVARHLERAGSTVDVVALIASSVPNALLEPLYAATMRTRRLISNRGTVILYKFLRSIVNTVRTRSLPVEILNALYELWHPPAPATPADRIYSDRLTRHFPKRTARSIDLIWPDHDTLKVAGDPSMGWRRVARVRRHSVGGDHSTVLTEHLDEVGAALRRIFDAADRGQLEG